MFYFVIIRLMPRKPSASMELDLVVPEASMELWVRGSLTFSDLIFKIVISYGKFSIKDMLLLMRKV